MLIVFYVVVYLSPVSVSGIFTHSKWVVDSPDQFEDSFESVPQHGHGLAIETPRFNIVPHNWFDADREMGNLAEINAKLKVELNAPVDEDSPAGRTALAFAQRLKEDVRVSHALNAHIQKLNSLIQADDRPFSLLEEEPSSWAYCTCGTGENGTLTYADRDWPGVDLPVLPSVNLTSSLLQVTVRGRHLSIPRADKCDCANPWENFKDPSRFSTCSVNMGVTICLVRTNASVGMWTSEQLNKEAQTVLESIDKSYMPKMAPASLADLSSTNSFVELWKPYQFQL